MGEKFVKLPYDEFMTAFVPLHPRQARRRPTYTQAFDGVFKTSEMEHIEKDLSRPFIECVKKAGLCPGYQFVLKPSKPDEEGEVKKAYAGLYLQKDAPKDGSRPRWSKQKLWVEWSKETQAGDLVDHKRPESETASQRQRDVNQTAAHVATIFAHQHRTFLFALTIACDHARIFRWDRSGAVVTEEFNYHLRPELLGEFLWRFCCLSDEGQGHDPTASVVGRGTKDYQLMSDMAQHGLGSEDYVQEYFRKSLDGRCTRWKLSVEEEAQETSERSPSTGKRTRKRYFLVGNPHFLASGMAGRGTRGYVAIDCRTRKFVFLKDAWRVDLPGIDKEGDVLRVLNKEGVQYVPTLVCHGDVGEQRTIAQRIWEQNHEKDRGDRNASENDAKRNPLKAHTHYRLVTVEVGRPLSDFEDGFELVCTIYECMKGHMQAVEKAGILHRDISSGNMLIVEQTDESGKMVRLGMLNDWELSKPLSKDVNGEGEHVSRDGQRQPGRMGTWQFMSARLLNDANKAAEIQDELESFFHVLLYNGVRYLRHNCEDVGAFLSRFFDAARIYAGNYICGDAKMSAMWQGRITLRNWTKLRFEHDDASMNHPLNDIIDVLLMFFKAHYNVAFSDTKIATSSSSASEGLDPQTQRAREYQCLTIAQDMAELHRNRTLDHERMAMMIAESARTQLDEDRILAETLRSHHRMITVLGSELVTDHSWPVNDKAGDLLRKECHYKRTGGRKRDSRTMDNVEFPESKRLKTSTRIPSAML